MIRNYFFMILLIPVCCFFTCVSWTVRKLGGEEQEVWRRSAVPWSRTLVRLAGLKLDADLSALPEDGSYIFVSNHQSMLDIVILYTLLRFPMVFVAKEELYRVPVFSIAMKAAGHISVDRTNRRKAMREMERAKELLARGTSIMVFVEGTRNKEIEQLADFKTGGVVMAIKCDVPVIPVVMAGVGDISRTGRHPATGDRTVRVRALPPIPAGKYTLKERDKLSAELYETMNSTYLELRANAPSV